MPIKNQLSAINSPCSLPRWLKRNVPKGGANHFTSNLIGELGLHTVCDHAKCPNRMECYSQKTATFMILGDTCTRACRFCSVAKGRPLPPDPDEPRRVAEAVAKLQLEHAVITCVARDDLPDGGAEHFVQTIAAIRNLAHHLVPRLRVGTPCDERPPSPDSTDKTATEGFPRGAWEPEASSPFPPSPFSLPHTPTIEVLPSDFAGNTAAVDRLVDASPDVYNHNTETVPRLFRLVRGQKVSGTFCRHGPAGAPHKRFLTPLFPDYAWTLTMFRRIRRRNPAIALKTGLMLGLGETTEELLDTLADLFDAGCRLLTLGQYLQPSPRQMPVVRFVPPEEFEHLGRLARQIGFDRVAAGPFVRSSYHAREMARAEG
jgi:lipoic acid synthetase